MKLRKEFLIAAGCWSAIMAAWGGFFIHVAGVFPTEISTTALSAFGVGGLLGPLVVRFCGGGRSLGVVGLLGALGLLGAYGSAANVENSAFPLYASLAVTGASIMTSISLVNARIVKTCRAAETSVVYGVGAAMWAAWQAASPITPTCFLVASVPAFALAVLGFVFATPTENADSTVQNSETASATSGALNVRAFAAFVAVVFAMNVLNSNFFFSVFTPFVKENFTVAPNLISAAHQLSEFATVILLGALLAKRPEWTRRVFIIGGFLTAGRYALYRVAGDNGDWVLALISSCGHGASFSMLTSLVVTLGAASLLKGANAATTARCMSIVAFAAMALPGVVAPQVARAVLESTAGWSEFWLASAAALAVLSLCATFALPRFETKQTQAQDGASDSAA